MLRFFVNFSHSTSFKEQNGLGIAKALRALLFTSLCIGIIHPSPCLAQAGDYGAETIEDEDIPGLLSPEDVEDRGKTKSNKPSSNETSKEAEGEFANQEADVSEQSDGDRPAPSELNLNAKDVEITTLVKTISKVTGRNYIVDSGVKGKITIHLPTPVSMDEALRIFDSVLLLKGFTTVPVGDNVWKVIATKSAKTTTIPIVYESPEVPSDVLVTQLIRLKHVPATEMQQVMSQFVSKDGGINTFDGTNSLILIDSAANIHRLLELVERLDVPATDQDITIIPIEHAEAQDIAEKINDLLGGDEENQSSANNSRTSRTTRRSSSTSRRTSNTRNSSRNTNNSSTARRRLPLKILPDDRTNSLIVVADPELTVKVRALVEQLDSPLDKSSGRFFVYRLQHADAEELSEILNNLVSGATSSSETTPARTTGSSLSRSNANRDRGPATSNARSNSSATRRTNTGPQTGRVNFEGDVSIAPDPSTNSIVINASRSDYLRLKEVIKELDEKRRQVLVEATLLEVRMTEEEGFGVELQGAAGADAGGLVGQTNFGGLSNLLTNPSALSDLTLAAASTGTLTLPGGLVIPSQAALISAFGKNSNVNVLSSPNILATDNEEAEIIVGENVPFVSSSSTDPSNLNNTFNSIERQDVGITLRITPQISQGDYVNLSIFVEISNVVPDTRNSPNGPTTTIRTTETTVEVKDGQMIVTGGLISDNITEADQGIPLLKDIPLVGNLFKTNSTTQQRNNLLVFITPRVIRDQFEARESTIDFRDKIEKVYKENNGNPQHIAKLHGQGIDEVSEFLPNEENEPLPNPLTPPTGLSEREQTAFERTKSRLESLAGSAPEPNSRSSLGISAQVTNTKTVQSDILDRPITAETDLVDDSEVLKMKVSPNLPGAGEEEISQKESDLDNINVFSARPRENTLPEGDQEVARFRFKPSKKLSAPQRHLGGGSTQETSDGQSSKIQEAQSYVVLKSLSPEAGSNIPGTKVLPGGTIGLAIAPGNKRPFSAGARYTHSQANEDRFVVLGTYDSISAAGKAHSPLSSAESWNFLPQAESKNLGAKVWIKEE